jgi:hypothetical protein
LEPVPKAEKDEVIYGNELYQVGGHIRTDVFPTGKKGTEQSLEAELSYTAGYRTFE